MIVGSTYSLINFKKIDRRDHKFSSLRCQLISRGFIPGKNFVISKISPLGDPVELRSCNLLSSIIVRMVDLLRIVNFEQK